MPADSTIRGVNHDRPATRLHAVQIIGTIEIGAAGPSYSVRRLAEALAERGLDSEILSLGEGGDRTFGQARSRSLAVDRPCAPGLGSLLPSRELAAAIETAARSGAVLHAHGLWRLPNIYPARSTRRHNAPLVVSPRGMLSQAALSFSRWPKRLFWLAAQKRALQAAACMHATGAAEAVAIRAAGLSQPIAIIPNGIDVPDAAEVIRGKALRQSDGRFTVLQLGRIHPIKRVDRLIEAWVRLEPLHPAWRLRVVGPSEGRHGDELAALACRRGLRHVSFEPAAFGADKDTALREADLLVLASDSENFGMVVAEALANGTPVIATKGAPWPGLTARKCGWWIDPGIEPLAAALNTAMSLSRATLDDMGNRGRSWMLEEFSWGRVAADMEAVYGWTKGKGQRPACVEIE